MYPNGREIAHGHLQDTSRSYRRRSGHGEREIEDREEGSAGHQTHGVCAGRQRGIDDVKIPRQIQESGFLHRIRPGVLFGRQAGTASSQ